MTTPLHRRIPIENGDLVGVDADGYLTPIGIAREEADRRIRNYVPPKPYDLRELLRSVLGGVPETFARERRGETMTTDKTPGQIAFEMYNERAKPIVLGQRAPWDGEHPATKEAWEHVARAAYCASAATMGVDSWLVGAKSAADASAARAFALGVESCKALALNACSYQYATREVIAQAIQKITVDACGWVDGS